MSDEQLMKVLVVAAANEPFTEAQLARPVPSAGEVLVRIHASGVNPLDSKIRAGEAAHAKHPFPALLGMDLAGVVESIGIGVEDFVAGDEVYGLAGGLRAYKVRSPNSQRSMPDCLLASRRTSPCAMQPHCRW